MAALVVVAAALLAAAPAPAGASSHPGAPGNFVAVSGDGVLTLTWDEPTTNAAGITAYSVAYKLPSATVWTGVGRSGTARTQQLMLTNGTTYDLRVAALAGTTTGDYAQIQATPSKSLVLPVSDPAGLWSDGDVLWVYENLPSGNSERLHRIDLTTGLADSTTPHLDFDFESVSAGPTQRGYLWADGTRMWVYSNRSVGLKRVYAFTMADGTAETSRILNVFTIVGDVGGIWSDGVTVWAASLTASRIIAGSLAGVAGHLVEQPAKQIDVAGGDSDLSFRIAGIWSDGHTMWAVDSTSGSETALAFSLATRQRVPGRDFALDAAGTAHAGVWSDGETMWVGTKFSDRVEAVAYDLPPVVAPAAPTGVEVEAGAGSLTVSWSSPGDDGGRPVGRFEVRRKLTSDPDVVASWSVPVAHSDLEDLSVTLEGLSAAGHDVQVRAFNEVGEGDWSGSVMGTPTADTTAPVVTVDAGTALNTFSATDDDSGSTVWHYAWITGAVCGSSVGFASEPNYIEGADVSYGVGNNGQRLCFRSVDPSSNAGYRASDTVTAVAPDTTAPVVAVAAGTAPNTLSATDGDSGSTVWHYAWITGAVCGSSTVFPSEQAYTEGADVSYGASNVGDRLCFRSVDPSSNAGYRASGSIAAPPVVAVAAGTALNTLSATDDDSGVTVWHYAWIVGAVCGSSTVFPSEQAYTEGADVSYGTGNVGQRLCFRSVDPSSNAGYRASDVVEAVTPATFPTRLSEIMARPGDESVTLTWEAPYDGGSPITQYVVLSNPPDGICITSVPGCTVTGLANGTAYDFEVTTFNAIGSAASFFPLQVTPTAASRAAPGAPTAVQATAGDRSASVTWNAPTDTGSSRITSYTATATPGGRACDTSGTACTVTGLSNGTSYTFTVTAANSVGTSLASAPSAATTPEQPATDPPATDLPTTAPGGGGGGGGSSGGGGGGGSGSSGDGEEPAPDDGERAALMFEDVGADDFFAAAVSWMLDNSITTGCAHDQFCPGNDVTRQQFVVFLWRAASEPAPDTPGSATFEDVTAGGYADDAIGWAAQTGVTLGCRGSEEQPPRRFCPSAAATRAQLATLLYRYVVADGVEQPPADTGFSDVDPNSYYAPAVAWMVSHGITNGCSADMFCPHATATRAHAAAFMWRIDTTPESWGAQGILRTPADN